MINLFNSTIIHYSEIGLKGANRPLFEEKLILNIKEKTGFKPRKEYGRLVIDSAKTKGLNEIPGIAYFALAFKTKLDIKEICKSTELIAGRIKSIRVSAKRSNKLFKIKSPEINRIVSDYLINKGFNADINGEEEVIIEIGEKNAYIYKDKIKGVGGLPVSVSGKIIGLISGGIDSPVAAYKMIRRGCKVVLVHFYHNKEGISKIKSLAKKLSSFQGPTRLYLIPFENIQRKIITIIPAKYRMITYRRLMIKISEQIMIKEKAKGFVTGDNVGQVASQTLDNIRVIYSATNEPILNPLSGLDKQDIINEAKSIGTYELSIQPYKDCCSFLVAAHPETRARIDEIEKLESNLKLEDEIIQSLKDSKLIDITS